ncbi:hypothetical protein VDS42_19005 [Xanthomonas campestris pv. campestris]|nr:hypothetical protein [Xanthomonas campestris pv. campestris]
MRFGYRLFYSAVVLMFAGLSVAGVLYLYDRGLGREHAPSPDEAKYRVQVAQYNASLSQAAHAASNQVLNVVTRAWKNCAPATITYIGFGTYGVAWPSPARIDVCEVHAVSLAESRGYSRTEASNAALSLRAITERAVERAIGGAP